MAQIRRRGPRQYQACIRRKGYPPLSSTFTTRDEAQRWATETEEQVLRGHYRAVSLSSSTTLQQALDRYSREVTPHKKGAVHEMGYIRRWQLSPLAQRPLSDLRGADRALHRDTRMAGGTGANTVRLEFALISHLYEVARKDWGMETLANPVKSVRKPKVPRGRDRRLLEGEEEALRVHCHQTGKVRLWAAISLAVHTAMRRSELVRLRWEDINQQARIARLHDTKNGDARLVPLSSAAMAALATLPKATEGPVLGVCGDTITWHFADACAACNITGLRFHDLRHEATSRLFEKGLNMMEVSTITGHKCLQMLKRYTHLRPSDLLAKLG